MNQSKLTNSNRRWDTNIAKLVDAFTWKMESWSKYDDNVKVIMSALYLKLNKHVSGCNIRGPWQFEHHVLAQFSLQLSSGLPSFLLLWLNWIDFFFIPLVLLLCVSIELFSLSNGWWRGIHDFFYLNVHTSLTSTYFY